MKNNALVILVILLLVSAALNVRQWQSAKEENLKRLLDNGRAQVEIAAKHAEILSRDSAILRLQQKTHSDSLEFKSRLIARNAEIQAYRQTIAKLRPLVAAKIDSFPDLREFVANQDSVISKQDSLLRDTELFCQLQVRDLQDIIRLQEQKYHTQAEISEVWRKTAEQAQADAAKEKRKGKFKSFVIGGLIGIAVYLSVKP